MGNNFREGVPHKGAGGQALQIRKYVQQILDGITISPSLVVSVFRKEFPHSFACSVRIFVVTGELFKDLHMNFQRKISWINVQTPTF